MLPRSGTRCTARLRPQIGCCNCSHGPSAQRRLTRDRSVGDTTGAGAASCDHAGCATGSSALQERISARKDLGAWLPLFRERRFPPGAGARPCRGDRARTGIRPRRVPWPTPRTSRPRGARMEAPCSDLRPLAAPWGGVLGCGGRGTRRASRGARRVEPKHQRRDSEPSTHRSGRHAPGRGDSTARRCWSVGSGWFHASCRPGAT
jgi:hypothetical protein